jgi:hypothetical protein
MAGEVLKIRRSHGDTIIEYRVPDFHNFGDRMEQIQDEYLDVRLQRRDDDTNEQRASAETELPGLFGKLMSALTSRMEDELRELRESRPDAARQMKKALGELEALGETSDDRSDADDDSPDQDADDELEAPHVIEIVLSKPLEWNKETQGRVDEFLSKWPSLRSGVRKAFFEAYREQYDDLWAFLGGHPADKIRFPDPTGPEVIENLFRFDLLHLSPDSDAIGFQGTCTWDDEHGVGARFEAGALVEVGQADVAFQF